MIISNMNVIKVGVKWETYHNGKMAKLKKAICCSGNPNFGWEEPNIMSIKIVKCILEMIDLMDSWDMIIRGKKKSKEIATEKKRIEEKP